MPLSAKNPATGSAEERRSYPSIWMFLAADSISFGLFFLVFMIERFKQPELFASSAHTLNTGLGLLNTIILITGSWFVALAVSASRENTKESNETNQERKVRRLLTAAILVSSLFIVVKVVEYGSKISEGITLFSNDFYMFYFALTGFHLVHYLLGMAALIYLAIQSREGMQKTDGRYQLWLESGALFWHLVDLLWIFLFAMLYLLGAQL